MQLHFKEENKRLKNIIKQNKESEKNMEDIVKRSLAEKSSKK